MAEAFRVDLYCEDRGHEQFVRALIQRLAREERLPVAAHTASGRGGHGRAVTEFRAWQKKMQKGEGRVPELLILTIDANCSDWNGFHKDLEEAIDPTVFPRWVVGCPEPHVERWCLADPTSFRQVVGGPAPDDPGKCERALYKRLLRESILAAGQLILTDEMEFAPELVQAMDLYRAGKRQRSLGRFVDELRLAIRSSSGLA